MTLEPLKPARALELFIDDRNLEVTDTTLKPYEIRLGFFVDWCADQGIDNLNDLTGRNLQEYRMWRRDDGDLAKVSVKTQMDTLRVFVKFLESIDAVEQDLHHKVRSPDVTPEENSRSVMLDPQHAQAILEYLGRYEYASIRHTLAEVLWHTMIRIGAAHGLDVDDYDPDDQSLELHHRPDTGTPLKNKERGERHLALSDQVCLVLDDWIQDQRPNVTDEYGRTPLFASPNGRAAISTLRTYCYQITRPCTYGQKCPHYRKPQSCTAMEPDNSPHCPSSVSPHPFRRGAITHFLKSDVPETAVSGRANVSPDVLEQHYDQRSEKEKMEQRRQYLDKI